MSANCKVIVVIVALSLLICLVESKVMAGQRPRIIRAEYRNKELSMARGYGKRDVNPYLDNDSDEKQPGEKLNPLPIDWLVDELIANPKEFKAFLSRFFDANKDGKMSVNEFLGNANVSC